MSPVMEADVDFGAWAHAPIPLHIAQILWMLVKILLHRNTQHQILWRSQRSGMESQLFCQDLRNSTEWNLPACGFKKSAYLSQEKLVRSKWKSLMFLFIWHIIPPGYETALLKAATNGCLDLWCQSLGATHRVRSSAQKDVEDGMWGAEGASGPAALVSAPPLTANSPQALSSFGLQFLQV